MQDLQPDLGAETTYGRIFYTQEDIKEIVALC